MKLERVPLVALIMIEFLAIVLAVMLGFWVTQWRESRINKGIVENARQSLVRELSYNQERMILMYTYYDDFITNVKDSIQTNPNFNVRDKYGYHVAGWRGAMTPLLRSSSYAMIVNSGILKDFDFESADAISQLYNMQAMIERLDDAMMRKAATDEGFTRLQDVYHMFNLYNEIIPLVLGFYQMYAVEYLDDAGFEFLVENPTILQQIEMQMQ
ncbi:MAG: hypothetical protein LAT57_02405 [Balneolales bacterium]|nr:hypothetical protein [Balneolales bacterium]